MEHSENFKLSLNVTSVRDFEFDNHVLDLDQTLRRCVASGGTIEKIMIRNFTFGLKW
jgi:hypothetical protein